MSAAGDPVVSALCRKIAHAEDGGEIEIWGNGLQTRSYCYIEDCVAGIYRLMRSGYAEPLNLAGQTGSCPLMKSLT